MVIVIRLAAKLLLNIIMYPFISIEKIHQILSTLMSDTYCVSCCQWQWPKERKEKLNKEEELLESDGERNNQKRINLEQFDLFWLSLLAQMRQTIKKIKWITFVARTFYFVIHRNWAWKIVDLNDWFNHFYFSFDDSFTVRRQTHIFQAKKHYQIVVIIFSMRWNCTNIKKKKAGAARC